MRHIMMLLALAYKMLAGRLYNAGVLVAKLEEVFKADRKTIRSWGTEIEVHLVPQVNYEPKLRKIITAHLDELNAGGLTLPDGSGRPLRLRLTSKEQISVRINDGPGN